MATELLDKPSREEAGRFVVHATADTHFSWLRTRLSIERTLLAWVRTAVALIGFGFTIVQFFDRLANLPGVAPATYPQAPRYMGLALIASGVLALVISIWQYRRLLAYLFGAGFAVVAPTEHERQQTPVIAVALVLILIGVAAFLAVLTRYV